jgi:hypothetical protein
MTGLNTLAMEGGLNRSLPICALATGEMLQKRARLQTPRTKRFIHTLLEVGQLFGAYGTSKGWAG